MNNSIEVSLARKAYAPNEIIRGEVRWNIPEAPGAITISIGWYTAGKGTMDHNIEHRERWATDDLTGTRSIAIPLPPEPYSFSGTLIELLWYVEARVHGSDLYTRTSFDLSPERELVKI